MCPVGKKALQQSPPVRAILVQSLYFFSILILIATPLYAIEQNQLSSIHYSILALDSARQTALHELEETALSASEVDDYRDFIVYLNTRIINYCQELAEQASLTALEGLPCPSGPVMTGTGEPSATPGDAVFYTTGSEPADTRTQAEKTSELDGGFLTALGDFDEMLLKEEEKVASRVPSQRESGSTGQEGTGGDAGTSGETGEAGSGEASGQGAGTEGDAVADGRSEGQPDRSGSASGTQSSSGAGSAAIDHSKYGAPGGKLPPPEDDDIVARQLREAAEKEPDPELKKKLWEEYWKYKGVSK
jgi:hypothetical protein